MSKRRLIILIAVVIGLISIVLLYTYASDITMEDATAVDADIAYNIDITDTNGRNVSIEAGKTKIVDFILNNTNNVKINYGLAYSPAKPSEVVIAQLNTSVKPVSGLIPANTKYIITLVLVNNTEVTMNYNIIPVVGYENGGDLIVPSGYTLITDTYSVINNVTMYSSAEIEGGKRLTNLISNSGFEDESNNWTLSNAQISNDYKKSGNNSLLLLPNTTSMSTQSLSITAPTLDHKYYGRLDFLSTDNFTSDDNRFEWYTADDPVGTIIFANKNTQRTGWQSISSIQTMMDDTYLSNNWTIRNFEVNANTNSYVDNLMLIDLTETFGVGYEPTKEELDASLDYFDENDTIYVKKGISSGNAYTFTFNEIANDIVCTNNAKATISGNQVTISGINGSVVCKANTIPANETIIRLSQGNTWSTGASGLYEVSYTKEDGTTIGKDYRYIGANVHNYVKFNNDLYQIIGVFDENTHGKSGEQLIKLISANKISANSWGVVNTGANTGIYSNYYNDWTGKQYATPANINILLNEYFLNKTDTSSTYGSCSNWTYFYNSNNYKTKDCQKLVYYGIDESLRNYIETTTWHLNGYNGNELTSNNFYLCERGMYTNCKSANNGAADSTTTAKIGLMYVSDYMYASGYKEKTSTLTGSSFDNGNQNWLYNGYEWTITPYYSSAYDVFRVSSNGDVLHNYSRNGYGARPTFYLKSSVYVTGGDGSIDNPYTIGM